MGTAFPNGEKITFNNTCFQENTVQVIAHTNSTLTLEFDSAKKSGLLCYDWYLIMTVSNFHEHNAAWSGSHQITLSGLNELDWKDINFNGIRIFKMCDSFRNTFKDVVITAEMFLGGFGTNPEIPFFGSHVMPW